MKIKLATLAMVALLLSAVTLLPMSVEAAQPTATAVPVPITGTFAGGTFNGVFNITNVAVQNGQLVANGLLSGTLTSAGQIIGQVTNLPVTLPLSPSGSCQILHLTLGPLDLNLLGLMVHLNQVVLDITAQSGPGNLLGNLLCAVAHLLDSNASLNAISNLLNHILGLLNL